MTDKSIDLRNKNKCKKLMLKIKSLYPEYEYMLKDFIFTKTTDKSIVNCKIHGQYQQSLFRLSKGFSCLKCSAKKNSRNIHEIHISELKSKALNISICNKNKTYFLKNDTILLNCKIHGDFEAKVKDLSKLSVCVKCFEYSKSYEYFIKVSNKIHKNKYLYPNITHNFELNTKIRIQCPIHGIFEQSEGSHRRGAGCPKCSAINVGLKNKEILTGKSLSYERKQKQSNTMKNKIAKGEFTPCVTNSWAKSRCYIDDIPFRSSWEAMFYLITELPYEKIRIPYIGLDNKKHSYIIDFHDEENKILYEIKPNSLIKDEKVKIKEGAAKEWCKENEWTFEFISEKYLFKKISIIKEKIKNKKIEQRTINLINNFEKQNNKHKEKNEK